MGFWEEYANTEAAKAPVVKPAGSQNAPSKCAICSTVDADVLLGVCADCLAEWEARR